MSSVPIEQKSYEMPPRDGFTVTHFITVADIDRSADFYEQVFGGRILSRGDSKGASGHIQIANTWLIVNIGGGPTPDKPSVTLSVPADPDKVSSFLNIRVADIQACKRFPKSGGWGYAVFNYEAASDKFTADPKSLSTADTRAIRP